MAPRLFACFGRGVSSSSTTTDKPASSPDLHDTADQAVEEQRRGGAVLVELFSSRGCGTSTDAAAIASHMGCGNLGLDVPVVVLAWHVDYWDYQGRKDPFGLSVWTVSQKALVESLQLH
ncbi:Thioredoxin-like protein [Dioscorea alata]|uniref:Thioredoxin-like protein n=1 Tax=Dioscorea alata TaxID=55571 RepID=A0ACB7UI35_DIOAL|nr:Thioredoxin-like protein [Dioscorea alata]